MSKENKTQWHKELHDIVDTLTPNQAIFLHEFSRRIFLIDKEEDKEKELQHIHRQIAETL